VNHHSPRFRIDSEPGAFREARHHGPFAEVLRRLPEPITNLPSESEQRSAAGLQSLAARFRNEADDRIAIGSLPLHVTFPVFGPSVHLASELTDDGHVPSIAFTFKRTRR
jgi:hypothetical protein